MWDDCFMKNPAYQGLILEHFKYLPRAGKGTLLETLFMRHMMEQVSEENPQRFEIGNKSYKITNQQPFSRFNNLAEDKRKPDSHKNIKLIIQACLERPQQFVFGYPSKHRSDSDSTTPGKKPTHVSNSPYIDFILARYNPLNEAFEINSFDIGVGQNVETKKDEKKEKIGQIQTLVKESLKTKQIYWTHSLLIAENSKEDQQFQLIGLDGINNNSKFQGRWGLISKMIKILAPKK